MLPPARPRLSLADLERDIAPFQIDRAKYPLLVVGYRGYYRDTMGKPGVNDRSLYDDAIMLVTPNAFLACNGNTDPTAEQGAVTGRASLKPGFYPMWRLDLHRGKYLAFCQRAGPCTVRRDNTEQFKAGTDHDTYGHCLGNGEWTGEFGINGHRGGLNTTSSEGCQTIPEPQWSALIALAESEARRLWGAKWRQTTIPYVLIDKAA